MPLTLWILSPGTSWSLVRATEPGRRDAILGQGSTSECPEIKSSIVMSFNLPCMYAYCKENKNNRIEESEYTPVVYYILLTV